MVGIKTRDVVSPYKEDFFHQFSYNCLHKHYSRSILINRTCSDPYEMEHKNADQL